MAQTKKSALGVVFLRMGPTRKVDQMKAMRQPKVAARAMVATSESGQVWAKLVRNIVKVEFMPMLAKSAMQAPIAAFLAFEFIIASLSCTQSTRITCCGACRSRP